ncbi:uncharacterized protein LOC120122543 [Hibiscus syriacus]|uniref:uncharacterized protein LOC120122543 n=1 Tax=Hibiscus syriacus TaxID=106335 RepID=UPI0019207E03|nr:uncharacterized protein LOC120122543 [Hibiscus syriacus]
MTSNMGTGRNWFNTVRKRFIKSSNQRDTTILHSGNLSQHPMIKEARDFPNISASSTSSFQTKHLQRTLQQFKSSRSSGGHLARRAYRSLRSLVKLQAVTDLEIKKWGSKILIPYSKKFWVTGQSLCPPTAQQVQ